jgi:hypothetical protein
LQWYREDFTFTPGSITASCKRKCCRNETPAQKRLHFPLPKTTVE